MDAVSSFLDGPRAQGAFVLRAVLEPPFSLIIEDEAPLTVIVVLTGSAFIGAPSEGHQLEIGDVAIARGPDHYLFADRPGTPPQLRILPGQACVSLTGESMAEVMGLGVRTWGNRADASTVVLIGTYAGRSEVGRRLTAALPALAVLRAGEWDSPVLGLLAAEATRDQPGQQTVLDRLLDLVVVDAVRAWFDSATTTAPGWYAAAADPVVGAALRLLHDDPAHAWTVEELAREVGVSRASFARRFSDALGEPPMTYLTAWRLALAADLLLDAEATVGRVARQVGYGSSFALSVAFKRAYGRSPREHRAARRTA
ncbi:AraC family transcriptional regulator [Nocardioides sp.]|uniref:AraC family transcriptional regulator n=1 Tax=Nocardioides sp. TaxID=35761 RepID=UPI003D10B254